MSVDLLARRAMMMSANQGEWTATAKALLQGTMSGDVVIPEGVTTLRSHIFQYSPITSITLPQSLTTIGEYAFANTRLTNIVLPPYLESIGASAFDIRDTRLQGRVVIPVKVKTLRQLFFLNDISEFILPEGLTTIDGGTRFVSAEWLTIPSSCENIKGHFPYQNDNLQGIIMLPATPPTYTGPVSNPRNIPFYVPDESVEVYQSAGGNWEGKVIKPMSELPDGVTPIVTQDIPEYNINS